MKILKIKPGVYVKYDYIKLTMFYGRVTTNLFYVANSNCRDKVALRRIIDNDNNNTMKSVELELKKIDYIMIEKSNYEPNCHLYYIIKNTPQSISRYNDEIKNLIDSDKNSIKIKINEDVSNDNDNATKLDLSDLD